MECLARRHLPKLWFDSRPLHLQVLVRSWSSQHIRSSFIDFFKSHGHEHIASSSVIPPKGDGTYFTNAGMNQFKPIFLGTCSQRSRLWGVKRAVNSQKCIRVGGKHNDLEDVGQDLTHHTFFEMLGNWSFGDYFKREACTMAFELLTEHYRIPLNRLYFTYFAGDEKFKLPADEECLDIWASLGISRERILPFGVKDNFWDMGMAGPCGPCTEIHFDHVGNRHAPSEVNADSPTMVEIWNLVFMQYNRQADQTLEYLPAKHIDTGMGLERMTAIMNGTWDNYATDLFQPIFSVLNEISKCPVYSGKFNKMDTSYRILADHMRMITVAIGDGLLPSNENLGHKLRGVLHKCIHLSGTEFKVDPHILLPALVVPVVSSLIIDVINSAIDHHSKMLDQAKRSFNKMMSRERPTTHLSGETILSLEKGSYGRAMSLDFIELLAANKGLQLHKNDYEKCLEKFQTAKATATPTPSALTQDDRISSLAQDDRISSLAQDDRISSLDQDDRISSLAQDDRISSLAQDDTISNLLNHLVSNNVPSTDDSFKYAVFSDCNLNNEKITADGTSLQCLIQGMSQQGQITDELTEGHEGDVILDNTIFYAESGGQEADTGTIVSEDGSFIVTDVQRHGDYVVHSGHVTKGCLKIGQAVKPCISMLQRRGNMRNHTGTHLLHAALQDVLPNTQQQGSSVTWNKLTFDFLTLSPFGSEGIEYVGNKVVECIQQRHPVETESVPFSTVHSLPDVRLNANEEYPDEVRLVSILGANGQSALSRELCGGTHASNTSFLMDFCITHLASRSQNVKRATCVTGSEAEQAHWNGQLMTGMCDLIAFLVTFKGSQSELKQAILSLYEKSQETMQYLAERKLVLEMDAINFVGDGCTKAEELISDTERALLVATSLSESLCQVVQDSHQFVQLLASLIKNINKAQQLDLLPKMCRAEAVACLQKNEHKVSERINAKNAEILLQQINQAMNLLPDPANAPCIVDVSPDMNPRQVIKILSKNMYQRSLILIQASPVSQQFTIILACDPNKLQTSPKEFLVNSLRELQGTGKCNGKIATQRECIVVYSISIKGDHLTRENVVSKLENVFHGR